MCFDEDAFRQISVQKLCAARIPLAATSYFYGDMESMKPWLEFTAVLARWSQMLDDLFDWHRDLRDKKDSYVLSQARRHKREGETVESWMAQTGFDWGMSVLRGLAARIAPSRPAAKECSAESLSRSAREDAGRRQRQAC